MQQEWINGVITYLPTLLTGLGIFVIGWLVAWVARELTRRIARRLGIDGVVERTGLAESLQQAQITREASDIIAQLFFWFIFLSFALIALETTGIETAVLLLQKLVVYLPRILAAIFVLIVGAWLSQLLGRLVQAATDRLGVEFNRQLGQILRGLLLVMTVILAIEQLGFDVGFLTNTFTYLLAITFAGLALTFGLGSRDVSRNILAGYYARDFFTLGDRIEIEGQEGVLDTMGTLNSALQTERGRYVIPNSWLIEKGALIQEEE
ncbi:MAG: mechanosensitive ion channel family protein [Ardenticatenaceae bacterium]